MGTTLMPLARQVGLHRIPENKSSARQDCIVLIRANSILASRYYVVSFLVACKQDRRHCQRYYVVYSGQSQHYPHLEPIHEVQLVFLLEGSLLVLSQNLFRYVEAVENFRGLRH